ncbi:hypothetical protein DSL72_003001 [Monilinia vaccinii-corymbosi]|uniref:Uncharacterized protein n=1 Tax=Monilinia vaccinii-corymbosi TaxID=61207 RepID=A0A8A3NYL6_9HELO|nr:hypothetical protein DSL72_003001 [Monilinia vaccinii-corymbosi]
MVCEYFCALILPRSILTHLALKAISIASKNPELYGAILDSTYAAVFLGFPHRPRSYSSLIEGLAALISNVRVAPRLEIIAASELGASSGFSTKHLFLESRMLLRIQVVNVFSNATDNKLRVFNETTVTMDWTSEVRIEVDGTHTTLLCGEAGKALL